MERILENPDGIKKADIVVGIPSYNEADSIGYVVERVDEGLSKYFGRKDTAIINVAARMIWSIIQDRYSSTTAMEPEDYTAGDGTYPMLESMNAELAAAIAMNRQGADLDIQQHWVVKWAQQVRLGLADVVAT